MKTPVFLSAAIVSLLILAGCAAKERPENRELFGEDVVTLNEEVVPSNMEENRILGSVQDRGYTSQGRITIRPFGDFDFDPAEVSSVRNDIFRDGHFSVFDILVHLSEREIIDLEFHFDDRMNTHIIDSINGEKNYWYTAYYDGGWSENNVFRMDHFPYKDRMHIRLSQYGRDEIESIYVTFGEEDERKRENSGKVIIPRVIIRGPTARFEFENVVVEPHDLRNDRFQEGVITAIDVIMSLGDEKKLSYDLRWYDSIGSAEVVKNYFVDRIDGDIASGRCGFVYESGSPAFGGFTGNHIHLPSDSRVLNSPEYVEFFWICI